MANSDPVQVTPAQRVNRSPLTVGSLISTFDQPAMIAVRESAQQIAVWQQSDTVSASAGPGTASEVQQNSVSPAAALTSSVAAPEEASSPMPTIATPFDDGWVRQQEENQDQILSGTTGVEGAGQRVIVEISTPTRQFTLQSEVDNNGVWHAVIPVDLMIDEFRDETYEVLVTAIDNNGQSGTATSSFTVDTVEPTVSIGTLAGNNIIEASELNTPLSITGRAEPGSAITVTFADKTWHCTVNESGSWQFTVPVATLQTLEEGRYTVHAVVSDLAGNTSEASRSVQVFASQELPSLTIDPVSGDNAVNYSEGIYGVEFNGTASHLPAGTEIALTLNGHTWYGNVADNVWRVQIGSDDLSQIPDGNYAYTVSATDLNGNTTSAAQEIMLITHYQSSTPTLTFNPVTQNDIVEQEGYTWLAVTGTWEDKFPLTNLSMTGEEGNNYSLTLHDDGTWSALIPPSAFTTTEGSNQMVFNSVDIAGNWYERQGIVEVNLSAAVSTPATDPETALPATEETAAIPHESAGDSGHARPTHCGAHTALDLHSLGLSHHGSETFDLSHFLSSAVTTVKEAWHRLDDASETFILKGADGNQVFLSQTQGGVWAAEGQRTADLQPYDHSHNSAAQQSGTLADMLIEHNLQVHIA